MTKKVVDEQFLIQVLKKEIKKTTGCTDPVSVALAVAHSSKYLEKLPEQITVRISSNIYKNGISVGVPGTGKRGLYYAAAIGVFLTEWTEKGLGLLDRITPFINNKAQQLLSRGIIKIIVERNSPDALYIEAKVKAGNDQVKTIIQGDYSNIQKIIKNRKTIICSSPQTGSEYVVNELLKFKIKNLVDSIENTNYQQFIFLLEAAQTNKATALKGLKNRSLVKLGRIYQQEYEKEFKRRPFPYSAMVLGKLYTAAAVEARMNGIKEPIMAIAGSGNHGITNFLGVLAVAEILKVSREQLARALAISSVITIYIKGYINRMTAFCGCAVAAATGVAAATVYLNGGNYQEMIEAMNSVVGSLAGIICDGAKESCAYKVSIATSTAIEYAYLARNKVFISKGVGIIACEIEETFKNMGKINNPGMVGTDKCLVEIIKENNK